MTMDQIRRRMAWEVMRHRLAVDDLQAPTGDQLLADLVDPFQAHRRRHPMMALAWDLGSRG